MPAPERFETDRSLFPLVISTLPARPTSADVDALITSLTELLEQRRKFVNVVDCTHQVLAASSFDRRRMIDWIRDPHLRGLSVYKLVDVIVTKSALVRAATTATSWMVPSASPILSVARLADAEGDIRRHCSGAGVEHSEAAWRRIRSS